MSTSHEARASEHFAPTSAGSTMGLRALRDELLEQGVDVNALARETGVGGLWFDQPEMPISNAQRLAIMRNAQRLAHRADTALRAGTRQRIGDFGLYGFGMASSETLGDCLDFGFSQLELAGNVVHITRELRGTRGVFVSHNPRALGNMLPFVAEFWRSSMTRLMSTILGTPFPSLAMYFPYPEPAHVASYRDVFHCHLVFDAPVMEWHYDASALDTPLPNASRYLADLCGAFCQRIIGKRGQQTPFEREVRMILLSRIRVACTAPEVARELGVSTRSLYRHLADAGISLQSMRDDVRLSLAEEFLSTTPMPIDEVAGRIGFSDAANFRKAFKRWTGETPSAWRARQRQDRK